MQPEDGTLNRRLLKCRSSDRVRTYSRYRFPLHFCVLFRIDAFTRIVIESIRTFHPFTSPRASTTPRTPVQTRSNTYSEDLRCVSDNVE